jgi:hypothetical protein
MDFYWRRFAELELTAFALALQESLVDVEVKAYKQNPQIDASLLEAHTVAVVCKARS